MKVIVAGDSSLSANMVRGAFQQMKVANIEVIALKEIQKLRQSIGEETVVLVDWEGDTAVCTAYVSAAHETDDKTPILLLCPKSRAGTTFAGMKAGARGVINKPIDPEALVKAVVNALRAAKSKGATVNVEFINPFIDATRNVFSTMCQMEIQRKKLFLKDDHKMLGDVSGVMGLSGDATGSVVVSLPAALACEVVGKMLGEEPAKDLNSDVCDGVGEIINMIAGQAKSMLVKTKYHFTISIPSVVSGPGHEITHKKGTPNIVVLFEAEGQNFALQVCLAPTADEG